VLTQGNDVVVDLVGERVRLRGTLSQAGKPVVLRREQPNARDRFLWAGVDLKLNTSAGAAGHNAEWAGIQIHNETVDARTRVLALGFMARLGVRNGEVFAQLIDGDPTNEANKDKSVPFSLGVRPAPGQSTNLRIEVLRGGRSGNEITIQFHVDGKPFPPREVKKWTSVRDLNIDLFGEGGRGQRVDAEFDGFLLIRRRGE
jgi:hypothetical protein